MSGKNGKKNDGRGAKAGVPHITNKVIAMDEAGREAWLSKCPDAVRDEVRARLADVLANGRSVKGKVTDYASLFNGKSYDELQKAEKFLQTAKEDAKREEFKRLQGEADAIRERLESLKA
jgi:hypothetical protein